MYASLDLSNSVFVLIFSETPGYENMDQEMKELQQLKKLGVPLIGSVYGTDEKEFAKVASWMAEKKPAAIELDLSLKK